MIGYLAAIVSAAVVMPWLWRFGTAKTRSRRLSQYVFPPSVINKVNEHYPHLNDDQVQQVLEGLRSFFAISLKARGRMVAMPSKAVDVAWHEFIVCTRAYQQFCQSCLGRFLHHTPSESMESATVAQAGIKRAWRLSCQAENINPKTPGRLPLLFAIDGKLKIDDGYKYTLYCRSSKGLATSTSFCASHIGCGGGSDRRGSDCGGDFDDTSCGGSSDGGGSSCGGGGCGGGD